MKRLICFFILIAIGINVNMGGSLLSSRFVYAENAEKLVGDEQIPEKEKFRIKDVAKGFNISGMKAVNTSYTKSKGPTSGGQPEGLDIKQSLRLLVEGQVGQSVNARMNYDDSQEQPLEMLINYQQGPFSGAMGDLDIVLDETEFALYNKRMFGISGGAELEKFKIMAFGAKSKGVSKTKAFTGKIGTEQEKTIQPADFIQRKYYQLLEEKVNGVYVDDGVAENGPGFDLLQDGIDYIIENGVLIFKEAVEENGVVEVAYETSGTRTIKGPAGDAELKNYYFLGYPNVIEGSLIVKDINGVGITNYTVKYAEGILCFSTELGFKVSYDYRNKDYQLDPPVLAGSEKVKVDGVEKKRGVDYYINYETGSLSFIDDHLSGIYDDSLVVIDYESAETSKLQNLLGLRTRYAPTEKLKIGATYLFSADEQSRVTPNINIAPIGHQIIGLDTQFSIGQVLNITAEVAGSKRQPQDKSTVWIDDMEGNNLVGGEGRWKTQYSNVELTPVKDVEEIHHLQEEDNHQVLRIKYGIGTATIEQTLNSPLNLSMYSTLQIWVKMEGTATLTLQLHSATDHYFAYCCTPEEKGKYLLVTNWLRGPSFVSGNPELKDINRIKLILNNGVGSQTTIYLDDLGVSGAVMEDGVAAKIEANIATERLNFKANYKEVDRQFNGIGLSNFEPINDTRQYQGEMTIALFEPVSLLLGYEDRLKNCSDQNKKIANKNFSGGLKLTFSEEDNISLEYKQEKEHDFKSSRYVDNADEKITGLINYRQQEKWGLKSLSFFSRLMSVETKDQIHTLHSRSDHTYLRLNIVPEQGMEIIPEYRFKMVKNLETDVDMTEDRGLVANLKLTNLKGLTTMAKYTNEDYKNFMVEIEQRNIGKSADLNLEPGAYLKRLSSLTNSIFYEAINQERWEKGIITSANQSQQGNTRVKIAPSLSWNGLMEYKFTRSEITPGTLTGKLDNYLTEINLQIDRIFPGLKRAFEKSQLTPRYQTRKTSRGTATLAVEITDIYFLSWNTDWKKNFSTWLQYEYISKETLLTLSPYIKYSYTPFPKLQLTNEFRQTASKPEKGTTTTDYFSSLGVKYSLTDKLKLSEIVRGTRNESDHKTTYSSSFELNWEITSKLNAILRYDWSDINDRQGSKNDFSSQNLNVDVTATF